MAINNRYRRDGRGFLMGRSRGGTLGSLILVFALAHSLGLFGHSAAFAQTDWVKYEDNPVLTTGSAGWDTRAVGPCFVMKDGDTYRMWYAGQDGVPVTRIGYATSPDGVNWTKHGSGPVLSVGQAGEWDSAHVTEPWVVRCDDTWHMWYSGTSDANGLRRRIGYAWSIDGVHWQKHSSYVLDHGGPGSWDAYMFLTHPVIRDDGIFKMWYAAESAYGSSSATGYAWSPDGVSWTKYAGNPVLRVESGIAWESGGPRAGTVIKDGDIYRMWFSGFSWSTWKTNIGYAESDNGVDWVRYDGNPVVGVGSGSVWDSKYVIYPSVLKDGAGFRMWYSGNPSGGTYKIGLAESARHFPIAVCKDVTRTADQDCQASVSPGEVDNGSYDPEGRPISLSLNPPGPYPVGTNVVTLTVTVTDDPALSSTCEATITVSDITAPVLSGVPGDTTSECDAVPAPPAVTAADGCDGSVPVSLIEMTTPGDCPDYYTVERKWSAADTSGNVTSAWQIIMVEDTTAPELAGVPADITVECDAVPDPALVMATDNCDAEVDVAFSEVRADGACPNSYTLTRTWIATDDCGNSGQAVQIITVVDTTPPTLTGVPEDITVECDAMPAPAEVAAVDNCDADVEITFNEDRTDGDCRNRYSLTRTWTATDDCGNTRQGVQVITVVDTTAPVLIGVPEDITVECDAVPDPAPVTATDNCSIPTVEFGEERLDGDCPNRYQLVRTWTATDACGNATSAAQVITVEDTTPPVITGVADQTVVPADCSLSVEFTEPEAADNCGPDVMVTCVPASGDILGPGLHTITCVAMDTCGNVAETNFTVTVLQPLQVIFEQPPLRDDNVRDDIETDLDAVNKFKVGKTIPVKVKILDCAGNDVTGTFGPSLTVRIDATEREDQGTSSTVINDVPEDFNGVGDPETTMVLLGNHFQYNLDTDGFDTGTIDDPNRFFRVHITAEFNTDPGIVVGEEDALLESK